MKPLHIILLVAAGAAGGAVIMRLAQRPQPLVARAPEVVEAPAQVQTPAAPQPPAPQSPAAEQPAPAVSPEPVVAQAPEPSSHPSPFPAARDAAHSGRVHRRTEVAVARKRPSSPVPLAAAPPAAPPVTPPSAQPVTPPAGQPVAPPAVPPAEPVMEAPASNEAVSAPQPIPPARSEPENATPAAPEPHRVTLNAGMLISVRLVDGLSSERSVAGDIFTATLDKELVVDGFVIAERGARVEGRVVTSGGGGKVKGVAALVVELTRLHTRDGQNVAIQTDSFERRAAQTRTQDAEKIGAGAAIGAVIGAIAGGGKGAAIGAGVGGGAGAGDVLLTRGAPARLPSETRISFRLRAPVTLTERLRV